MSPGVERKKKEGGVTLRRTKNERGREREERKKKKSREKEWVD